MAETQPRPKAHTPGRPERPWHDLGAHLRGVSCRAGEFVGKFGDTAWGELAGRWHDIGKASSAWQEYLVAAGEAALAETDDEAVDRTPRRKLDHSTAGAIHACEKLGPRGLPIAFAIAAHHSGLADRTTLLARLKDPAKRVLYDAALQGSLEPVLLQHDRLPALAETIERLPQDKRLPAFELFIRLLFSALVDADFLDTESYFADAGAEVSAEKIRARGVSLPEVDALALHLEDQLRLKMRDAAPTRVNQLRSQVLGASLTAAANRPGLFTLTVPTGGGKTLSSLAFALRHAASHDLERVVVALPFTTVIEQTAAVYREIFSSLASDLVIEHHSNLDPARETLLNRVASENWDARLVVTTQVQLFESLLSNRPAPCRKLHRLSRAVIVLDEVQSLPAGLLAPILSVLDDLVGLFGCTVLLTTATQPELAARTLGTGVRFPGFTKSAQEIIPESFRESLWDGLKRVHTNWPTDWDAPNATDPAAFWERLADRIQSDPTVLAIVHRKDDARSLWKSLHRRDKTAIHLSGSLCAQHRREVVGEIKRRLDVHLECRVVSTQLVEAGVDVDFPIVLRAMAGFESLSQSAGRCNREGQLSTGEFFVFEPPTSPPRELRLHVDIARAMLQDDARPDLFQPDLFHRYFDRLYAARDLDLKGIQPMRRALQFKSVSESFRMIDDSTTPVFVPFDSEAQRLLRALEHGGPSRGLMRSLQPYAVGVYRPQLDSLRRQGAARQTADGYWLLQSDVHYDQHLGLVTDADPSMALIL